MTVQVLSATSHQHSQLAIEEWFREKVELISLSPTPRQTMSRDYMNQIIAEIHENTSKIALSSRVFFLVTGHPLFNLVAVYALKKRLENNPFLLLVWNGESYHAYSSQFVLDYPFFCS